MQRFISATFIFIIFFASLWILNESSEISETIAQYVQNGDFLTFKTRYSAEEIMNNRRDELLPDSSYSYLESNLKFHPHLLMEIKYTFNQRPREGILLWSLVDGEIVLDTETWSKTHGFQDALLVDASRNEFTLINTLVKHNGMITKDRLKKELNLDLEVIEPWIESARSKHLIVQKGNILFLYFENPKIPVSPQTKINEEIVTKPYNFAQKFLGKFSKKQIERISKAAFGADFTIRSMQEVCLPVFGIEVLNPDGSLQTSYWNGVTGQRMALK